MTGATADALGVADRGRAPAGYYADIVIFDPDRIADTATYTNPGADPEGNVHAMVNGELAVYLGRLQTGVRAGRILRHKPGW